MILKKTDDICSRLPHWQRFELDENGWCKQAQHQPSPNFNHRPDGVKIDLLVIHNISLPMGEFQNQKNQYICDLFLNRLSCDAHPSFASLDNVQVSSHFLIERSGQLIQFVSTLNRAWHAGVSSFKGRAACNDFSIGIELEGCDFLPFQKEQYHTLSNLIAVLSEQYAITYIAGHEDIAPMRKTDPGPFFEWSKITDVLPYW